MITSTHRRVQKPEGGLEYMLWLAEEAAARRGKLRAAPRESKHAAGRTAGRVDRPRMRREMKRREQDRRRNRRYC